MVRPRMVDNPWMTGGKHLMNHPGTAPFRGISEARRGINMSG
jgi:hypothetical protein